MLPERPAAELPEHDRAGKDRVLYSGGKRIKLWHEVFVKLDVPHGFISFIIYNVNYINLSL